MRSLRHASVLAASNEQQTHVDPSPQIGLFYVPASGAELTRYSPGVVSSDR